MNASGASERGSGATVPMGEWQRMTRNMQGIADCQTQLRETTGLILHEMRGMRRDVRRFTVGVILFAVPTVALWAANLVMLVKR